MTSDRSGILVVEDQMLQAIHLSMSLEREGYEPMGPCSSVDEALDMLDTATPAAALLDINLGAGTTSEPIAAELARRKVPFAFLTAYSRDIPIVESFPDAIFEDKPVNDLKLRQLLGDLMAPAG